MALELFYSQASPYVRKVRAAAIEIGTELTLIPASASPVARSPDLVAANPLGKLPCLRLADGELLYDSRVICRYLDARTGAGLYPAAPRLWDSLTLEATADGILDAALLMVYESRIRPEARRHEPWVEGQWAKIARALDAVETRWMPQLESPLNIGQIAIGAMLGYLDFRHADRHLANASFALGMMASMAVSSSRLSR